MFIEIDRQKSGVKFSHFYEVSLRSSFLTGIACIGRMEKFSRCTSSFVVEGRSLISYTFPPMFRFFNFYPLTWS